MTTTFLSTAVLARPAALLWSTLPGCWCRNSHSSSALQRRDESLFAAASRSSVYQPGQRQQYDRRAAICFHHRVWADCASALRRRKRRGGQHCLFLFRGHARGAPRCAILVLVPLPWLQLFENRRPSHFRARRTQFGPGTERCVGAPPLADREEQRVARHIRRVVGSGHRLAPLAWAPLFAARSCACCQLVRVLRLKRLVSSRRVERGARQ